MTRDEHRAACIAKMWFTMASQPAADYEFAATIAFDSLHDIALVNPVEATEAMIEVGHGNNYQASKYFSAKGVANLWRRMSVAGRLTNPPEKKP